MTVLLDRQETAASPDWWQACFRAARQRGFSAERSAELADRAQRYAVDAAGHEHLPAGSPEGGEFTGKPEDAQSPNDMAVSLPTEEQPTVVTPTSQSVESAAFPSPDRMAQTLKLLDENMGLVKNAVRWAQGKYKGRDEHDLISNANMALWKAAQSWDESKGPFENYANVAIANAFKRGKSVQEHTSLSGKEGENIDVEAPREQEPTGPGVAEMHAEIAKLPTREREIMTKVAQGMKGEAIANALSIPHATVRTIIARTKPLLAAALQPREQYQAAHEILRYAEDASGHEHVGAGVPEGGQFTGGVGQSPNDMAAAFAQPQQDPMVTYKAIEDAGLDVAQSRARFDAEIAILPTAVLKQLALAKGYQVRTGEEAKKYLRQALEGFAVAAERNRGISRMESEERPERGPWKKRSPRHAVASAVNRLQSLEDHAAEYDADEIADVIGEIAEHFDADTFKDIVRRFGITAGQTKADLVRLLTERIGKTETANGEHL